MEGSNLQRMKYANKHPVDLNTVDIDDVVHIKLTIASDQQVDKYPGLRNILSLEIDDADLSQQSNMPNG